MSKNFKQQVRELNEGLRNDLANAEPLKKRVEFRKPVQVHGKTGKTMHKANRAKAKQQIRRGDWD